jgi:hypothetical protein
LEVFPLNDKPVSFSITNERMLRRVADHLALTAHIAGRLVKRRSDRTAICVARELAVKAEYQGLDIASLSRRCRREARLDPIADLVGHLGGQSARSGDESRALS